MQRNLPTSIKCEEIIGVNLLQPALQEDPGLYLYNFHGVNTTLTAYFEISG